ncbi:uncharacterized protein LOC125483188 isoform X3 [Rhincodon typus]|uniref:uncharacterized protein LOC125483188 isoform X3 n=1 Tax=Rhincodon typus TaxID=259920 RepID=UPI00202F7BF4|nr:uncharacterized protein LOC125483188 isoform X3 [Rhincodon typus]
MPQKSPSNNDGSKSPTIPAASAVQQAEESEECEPQTLKEGLPVQDSIPTIRFSTSKCLAKTPTNECMSERKRSLSPKLFPPCSPSEGCKYTIKATPVRHRMSAGHFSAWGIEDAEVLYYMQVCSVRKILAVITKLRTLQLLRHLTKKHRDHLQASRIPATTV